MRPNLPSRVTIETPGPSIQDPTSGNERPGPSIVELDVPARLSQNPVANISQQAELMANQQTVISMWTVLVGRDTTLTSASVVIDEQGRRFAIEGAVANRPDRHPKFRAAAARLISDLQ